MIKHLCLLAVFIGVLFPAAAFATQPPGFWQNPVIKSTGDLHPLPDAAYQPQKDVTYKAVFSVTRAQKNPKDMDNSLSSVARAVNLFVYAGVPLDHLKFVVIIHGGATSIALDNAHYKKEFGVDNPNLKVIKELKAAGVEIAVCGQALAGFN
ncbi:MAG: DsrE family protein, partial [Gammaproteobacteria bacterium]